jgi:hypothetical protein
MPLLPPADRRALLAIHQGHTPTERAACDPCRRARRVLALSLYYTLGMRDPRHPDDY